MFRYDIGEDAAAHIKFCSEPHEARFGGFSKIVEDAVGDGLMERALIAECIASSF